MLRSGDGGATWHAVALSLEQVGSLRAVTGGAGFTAVGDDVAAATVREGSRCGG